MAIGSITLTNGIDVKKAPIGFSWTTLFFGGFVPLIRQDWLWAVVLFALGIASSGVIPIVFSFFYNKIYVKNLFAKGYQVTDLGVTTEAFLKNELGLLTVPMYPKDAA